MGVTNDLVKQILISLKNPDEWNVGECTIDHSSGIRLWRGNGVFFLQLYPSDHSFNLWDKLKIWRAMKEMMALKSLKTLQNYHLDKVANS